MIPFKDITLQDKETISQYVLNSSLRNCDLSFSNLCSWRFLYKTRFAEINGFLVLKFWAGKRLSYMMPVGEGDLKSVLELMIEDAKSEGSKFRILGVCTEMKQNLEDIMPGRFEFTSNRNYADYLYLRTSLATLSGKKLQSKRNHLNKFRKSYNYEYLPITPELVKECMKMEAEWCKLNDCNNHQGTGNERKAIIYALENFQELGLTGGILRVDGQIVAFTFGRPINHDTFGVHAEKADIRIDGAYTMINYEFANHVPEQFIYLNREEDLGIEGLRKAKLSYQPAIILEKNMACLKEEPVP
ncbi:phosphatidylglycerol lysyltransferase domain-containing protein [Bacteroides sp. OttesenSCG-928-E20]|nr:phosphatidylglycerol lysyltransferase domain-containing protein [Bacteroides sp. OttesenSCG-928-N06]MDL2299731.1 phosphatidylglycerol lysyltransferase domain-containing protein [Bacteroides sp. OttesenSCG-928-E20]